MNQLILKGTLSQSGSPVEKKRDVVEDASWSFIGIPGNIRTLEELAVGIRTEHEKRNVHLTNNDIMRKQIGQPTHPITKALLDAEYQDKVDDEIRKTHKHKGWIERILVPDVYSYAPYQSPIRARKKQLQYLSNEELINTLFSPFKMFTNYGDKLENHFRQNTGKNLFFHLEKWADGKNTKKDALISVLVIKLFFTLKDWFGVDEEDVYKNEPSTQMGREYLAAFWVLQHQRGYRPFINIITYEEEITVIF